MKRVVELNRLEVTRYIEDFQRFLSVSNLLGVTGLNLHLVVVTLGRLGYIRLLGVTLTSL